MFDVHAYVINIIYIATVLRSFLMIAFKRSKGIVYKKRYVPIFLDSIETRKKNELPPKVILT